jgi:hypothetical protein
MLIYQSYLHVTHCADRITEGFPGPGRIRIFEVPDSSALGLREHEHDGTGASQALATAKRIILAVATSSAWNSVSRLPVPSLSLSRFRQRVTIMIGTKSDVNCYQISLPIFV